MMAAALAAAVSGVAWAAQAAGPAVSIDGTSGARERRDLAALVAESMRVLQTDRFRRNLLSLKAEYPRIYLRTARDGTPVYGTVEDIWGIISATAPRHRYVPAPVALVGGTYDETAMAGWTGYHDEKGNALGSMTLGRAHIARWLSRDVVEKSCSINTVTHEISHTVVIGETGFAHALMDEDLSPPVIGSYFVGTVAQCTWLQEQGRVSASDFAGCVRVFGYNRFDTRRCTAFPGTAAVTEAPRAPGSDGRNVKRLAEERALPAPSAVSPRGDEKSEIRNRRN